MTPKLVLFIGLQAAGKSDFYRACFAGTHDWVSKDRFRNNRTPAWRQRPRSSEFGPLLRAPRTLRKLLRSLHSVTAFRG
jgi:hypothetical protein